MTASQCTDPVIGDILSGWRYDISGLSPAMRTDYDQHLSEQNNAPELARLAAEQAIGGRMSLLGNRILLAQQTAPLAPICL